MQFGAHFGRNLEPILKKNGSSHAVVRPYESICPASKIEGLGPLLDEPETAKFGTKCSLKNIKKNRSNFEAKLMHFGSQNEAQKRSKIDVFFERFFGAPENIGESPGELRGSSSEAPGGTLSPGGVPRSGQLSKIIEYKQ